MKSHGKSEGRVECPECKAPYTRKGVRHRGDCRIGELQRASDEAVRADMESGREW